MRTFAIDTADLTRRRPVASLDWPDFPEAGSTPAGDDLVDG